MRRLRDSARNALGWTLLQWGINLLDESQRQRYVQILVRSKS